MAKLPAFQFYPADWRKDPGVQSLSFHDRGVWFEMLCLMHESEQRGKLLLNGVAMPEEALARLLGLDKQILTKTLTTLLSYGVSSLCPETGAIMCRRMVRDENLRIIRTNSGKLGGNPVLLNQNPNQKPPPQDNQILTTGVKQNPTPSSSASSTKQKKREDIKNISSPKEKFSEIPPWLTKTDWDDFVKHRRALKAPMTVNAWARSLGALSRLRDAGHDPAAVINQSIVNGWKGLFPLRNQAGGTNGQRKESSAERYSRVSAEALRRAEEAERIEKDITPFVEDAQSFSGVECDVFAEVDKSDYS